MAEHCQEGKEEAGGRRAHRKGRGRGRKGEARRSAAA